MVNYLDAARGSVWRNQIFKFGRELEDGDEGWVARSLSIDGGGEVSIYGVDRHELAKRKYEQPATLRLEGSPLAYLFGIEDEEAR